MIGMIGRLFVLGLFLFPIAAFGQTVQQQHVWIQGFSNIKLSPQWEVFTEIQARRADWGTDWQQFMVRGGILYNVNKRLSVGAGYGFIDTYAYGEQPVAARFPEHRIFQQATLKVPIKKVATEHRVRLEQRYLRAIDTVNRRLLDHYIYTNRVRYRSQATIPIRRVDPGRSGPGKGDAFFFANNEIFFNFGKNVLRNVLDQNRASAGIGYHFGPTGTMQVGYLHQYLQKGDGVRYESNHTLVMSFTYNFSLFK
jgi:hypothetical protein